MKKQLQVNTNVRAGVVVDPGQVVEGWVYTKEPIGTRWLKGWFTPYLQAPTNTRAVNADAFKPAPPY